jgi:lysophospholipase L1-like esterase
MRYIYVLYSVGVLLSAMAVFSCAHEYANLGEPGADCVLIEADSTLILFHGRIDRRNPKEPVFDWAASGFSVRFTGASIGLVLRDSGENDFSIFIDGRLDHRLAGEAGERHVLLAANLPPGSHRLDFYKATESDQGITILKGLLLESGSELLPLEKPHFRIQVFGDSACSGYGAAAPVPDDEWHREHADACRTWAFFIARAFGAELTLTAASGRGVLRNYGEPGHRSKVAFPELAWRVLLDDDALLVPETEPAPDLVIVCLGHNDLSPGYTLSRDEFRRGYLDFLSEIRRRWPGVPILCGSFMRELLSDWLREIVEEKTAAGERSFYWYAFSRLGAREFGCDHHANAQAHERRAREILPLVIKATGRRPVR